MAFIFVSGNRNSSGFQEDDYDVKIKMREFVSYK